MVDLKQKLFLSNFCEMNTILVDLIMLIKTTLLDIWICFWVKNFTIDTILVFDLQMTLKNYLN